MSGKASENQERSSFSGKIGYVLAAAGSAVGLGNIWRFPYLAAEYGGGIFLLVYIILAATFGYTMMVAETSLGRMTGKSPVGAYGHFGKSFGYRFGGWINAVIPMLIVPYYCVIGGWVARYLFGYLDGEGRAMAGDGFFSKFISSGSSLLFWFMIFALATIIVVYLGVKSGIERVSKVMMPVLLILALVIAVYSMTRPGAGAGVKYFLVPNFSDFSWMTVVAAMEQMFYSLSIAMGILITFGSYMKKDMNIETSTAQVEICDSAVAILAGLMIIPAVFAFSGGEKTALSSGPSLMFETMPKVFDSMGLGKVIGLLFFVMVLFAALTSSIALLESAVSTIEDELHFGRKSATLFMAVIVIALGVLSCLGFNVLGNVKPLGMDFLDFFDFITNSVMMPIAAICTCVLIIRSVKIDRVNQEVMQSSNFRFRGVFNFMIRYLCILFLVIILITSILSILGIVKI